MAGHDKTGRSTMRARFAALPHDVLTSPGYRACSPAARAVMLELIMLHNGFNNGKIGLSIRDAASRCNIGKATAARAFQELDDNGLVDCVEKGSFRDHHRIATTFRLLWLRCDVTQTIPMRRYRQAA
jgi:DNA-binding IclR family transcriptional regulator